MTSTEELKAMIVAAGGDVSSLPDNLETTLYKALCNAMGVDYSDVTDNLTSSYMKQIAAEFTGGEEINNQDKTITANGTYTADEGYTGLGTVNVSVVPTGDGYDVADSIIDRSITSITSDATEVGIYAFYKSNLTTADFPLAKRIMDNAFHSCTNLTTINFPLVTYISNNVFYSCKGLTTADFPLVKFIGTSNFYNCTNLTTADFPLADSVGTNAFMSCTNLTTINFPLLESIGQSAFYKSNFTTADFPLADSIGANAFSNCSNLTTLILRNTTACTLSNISAFSTTPIASGTGYIYVPRALVDTYKSATNWSTYADQFRALEDYTVDGTITGELDESKI